MLFQENTLAQSPLVSAEDTIASDKPGSLLGMQRSMTKEIKPRREMEMQRELLQDVENVDIQISD